MTIRALPTIKCSPGWLEVSEHQHGDEYWQNKEPQRKRGMENKLASFSFQSNSVRLIISDMPETFVFMSIHLCLLSG